MTFTVHECPVLAEPCSFASEGQNAEEVRSGQTDRCRRSHLLPGDRHVVLHVAKDSWLDEEASVRSSAATTQQFGSFSLPSANVTQDLLKLLLVYLRAVGTQISFSFTEGQKGLDYNLLCP